MSASPLSGLADGQIQRNQGNPIPYVMEPVWVASPARVLIRDGKRGPDATDAEWRAIQAKLAPIPDVQLPGPKPWMFQVRQPYTAAQKIARRLVHRVGPTPDIQQARKDANTKRKAEWKRAHKDKQLEYSRRWHQKHPEYAKQKAREAYAAIMSTPEGKEERRRKERDLYARNVAKKKATATV